MKIEIDTEHASKEELAHLARMLNALVGSSAGGNSVVEQKDVFEDPSPTGGLMNMFGDSSSSQPSSQSQAVLEDSSAQPAQPSQSGDLFSLFSSSDSQAGSQETPAAQPAEQQAEEEESKETTSAQDIIDDDSIVPYD